MILSYFLVLSLDSIVNVFKREDIYNKEVADLETTQKMFRNFLKEMGEQVKEETEEYYESKKKYARDKKIYESLEEDERASWFEEHGYVAEDFNDDVLHRRITNKCFGTK